MISGNIRIKRVLVSPRHEQMVENNLVVVSPVSGRDLASIEHELDQGSQLLFTLQMGNYLFLYFWTTGVE